MEQQFDLGFTIEEGLNTLGTSRSLLRRCTVFEWDTLLDLKLMLHLGWSPIRRLRIRQRVPGVKAAFRDQYGLMAAAILHLLGYLWQPGGTRQTTELLPRLRADLILKNIKFTHGVLGLTGRSLSIFKHRAPSHAPLIGRAVFAIRWVLTASGTVFGIMTSRSCITIMVAEWYARSFEHRHMRD